MDFTEQKMWTLKPMSTNKVIAEQYETPDACEFDKCQTLDLIMRDRWLPPSASNPMNDGQEIDW